MIDQRGRITGKDVGGIEAGIMRLGALTVSAKIWDDDPEAGGGDLLCCAEFGPMVSLVLNRPWSSTTGRPSPSSCQLSATPSKDWN